MSGNDRAVEEQRWNDAQLDAAVDTPRIRLWRHERAAIVLGRAQHALAAEPAIVLPAAIPLVTRQAGGGAVLVGRWLLSLSVALPAAHRLVAGRSIAASYDWIAAAFVAALAQVDVRARAADDAVACKAPPDLAWACFAGITAGEVLVDGRKLVGLAQRRTRHGVLVVAGLLLDTVPWRLLRDGMPGAVRSSEAERQVAAMADATIDLRTARALDGARAPSAFAVGQPSEPAHDRIVARLVERLVDEIGSALGEPGTLDCTVYA